LSDRNVAFPTSFLLFDIDRGTTVAQMLATHADDIGAALDGAEKQFECGPRSGAERMPPPVSLDLLS
jgi:hypothetical protein